MRRVSRPAVNVGARVAPAQRTGTPRPTRITGIEKKQPGAGVRKKIRGNGQELLICFGVLAAMGLIALLLYSQRTHEQQDADANKQQQEKIFKDNMQRGFDAYKRAESAGLLYVSTGEAATDDKLFGPFRNDDRVYNVIYDRIFKTPRVPVMTEQKAMSQDRQRFERMEDFSSQDPVTGVRCCYGFAENKGLSVVVASKMIRPKEGDDVNLPGTITIIVRADNDDKFERARHPKSERR